jgi:hypothetical protein
MKVLQIYSTLDHLPPPQMLPCLRMLGVNPEPVFVKDYGAQESIPRNRLRQPM